MARLLEVRRAHSGFLIAGANPLARALGIALQRAGQEVVLLDTDPGEVAAAEAVGLNAIKGNALDEEVLEVADLEGKEGIVSVIPNEGVGILVAEKARREYRVPKAYVAIRPGRLALTGTRLQDMGAQTLFGRETDLAARTGDLLTDRIVLRKYRHDASDRLGWDDHEWAHLDVVIPLVIERRGGAAPVGEKLRLHRSDTLTLLVPSGRDAPPAGFEAVELAAAER
jgi:hypothetical protein